MTEPLITISLSDYNRLIAKKDMHETLAEAVTSTPTFTELKEKLEKYLYKCEIGGKEITLRFLVDINKI